MMQSDLLCNNIILEAEDKKEWMQLDQASVGACIKMVIVRTNRKNCIQEIFETKFNEA